MSREYCDYLIDMLKPWDRVVARPMFSGFGLYRDGQIFALLVRETLYFKADDASSTAYRARGTEPFAYTARGHKRVIKSYWQVPADILEDVDLLQEWAETAYQVARSSGSAKPRGRKANGTRKRMGK